MPAKAHPDGQCGKSAAYEVDGQKYCAVHAGNIVLRALAIERAGTLPYCPEVPHEAAKVALGVLAFRAGGVLSIDRGEQKALVTAIRALEFSTDERAAIIVTLRDLDPAAEKADTIPSL